VAFSFSNFAMPMQVGGTVLSAMGELQAGKSAAQFGAAQNAAFQQQAGQVEAQGSQQAADAALQTKYVLSSVRARAAANGVSASGTTPVDIAGQIAARGSYNVLSALYSSQEKAAGLNFQGQLSQYEGQVKQQASKVSALSTVLSGIGSLATKYGNPGGAFGQTLPAAQNPEFGGAMPAGGLT
jgi:hypothetical protein